MIGNFSGVSPALRVFPCLAQPKHKIIILYWTKYFETIDFDYGRGRTAFARCDNSNQGENVCLTTMDRGLLNESDAVIFHVRDLKDSDLPPPEWRLPHQNFVFFLYESPAHTDLDLLQRPVFRNYFNRTMTYRRDSDVVDLQPLRADQVHPSVAILFEFPAVKSLSRSRDFHCSV